MNKYFKNLSYAAPFASILALGTLNWFVKSNENSFLISVPLFVSLFPVPFSFFNLKKNQPKVSQQLIFLCAVYAVIDFLILRFTLNILLDNSIVIIICALSFGLGVTNFLYASSCKMVTLNIIMNVFIFYYTLNMEKVETRGCLSVVEDMDTHISPKDIQSTFNLMYLIPIRIYMFNEYNKEENANSHILLSAFTLIMCTVQAFCCFKAFKEELFLIVKEKTAFFISVAPLAAFYVLIVCFFKKISYQKFVYGYSTCTILFFMIYSLDSPDFIFRKNALEHSLWGFYVPAFFLSFLLAGTSNNLCDSGNSLRERFVRFGMTFDGLFNF